MSSLQDNKPDRDEEAALWCLTLADGELKPADRIAFDRWVSDAENARAFEEATRLWRAADGAAEMPELIQMRSAALENFRRTNGQRWTRRFAPRWYWVGTLAASVFVLLLTASLLYTPMNVYKTGIGERQIAILADGSKVSLDADTEVDVKLNSDRRELTLLHGRAKFDVAKDPLRPFTVTAGDKMVVATGTSFSVELLNSEIHVLLYEGHVAVLDRKGHAPVPQHVGSKMEAADQALTPGKELVAAADETAPATIHNADLQRSLSWESGQLTFDEEPLATAVERMNRYSRQKLIVGDAAAAKIRVNGVFTAGDTDAFVEGVTALNWVRVDRTGDRMIFRHN